MDCWKYQNFKIISRKFCKNVILLNYEILGIFYVKQPETLIGNPAQSCTMT